MRLIEHLADLDEQGATKNYGEGRGIVTIAGNADTLERVLYMLRMMRHGSCSLQRRRSLLILSYVSLGFTGSRTRF